MKTSNQEQDTEKFLATVDSELQRVAAEAVVDLDQTEALVKKHEAVLQDGAGLLETVAAKSFLRSLDETLWPGMVALGGTANANRQNHFRFARPRLALVAKEKYIFEHGTELSAALEKLIAARSKGRDAWRNRLADEFLALERLRLLNGFQTLTVDQSRRLDSLEEILVANDSLYYEAGRLATRLRTAPNLETFNDARRFASQLNFDEAA
jgi:hypothetical protein